jgi:hypothetical protein
MPGSDLLGPHTPIEEQALDRLLFEAEDEVVLQTSPVRPRAATALALVERPDAVPEGR